MTRISIISDLHLDHWIRRYSLSGIPNQKQVILNDLIARASEGVDYVFIAGDFWDGAAVKLKPRNTLPSHVVTLWGNHDYYHEDWPVESDSDHTYLALAGKEPIDVAHATLWTGFMGAEYPDFIYRGISDSRLIKDTSTHKVINRHKEELDYLLERDADIIMTHFPPSYGSCAPKFVGDPYNAYFLNKLGGYDFKAGLWICGHVHHKHSYMMNNTLVVCNPLGYPGENYNHIDEYQPMIVEKGEDGQWAVR